MSPQAADASRPARLGLKDAGAKAGRRISYAIDERRPSTQPRQPLMARTSAQAPARDSTTKFEALRQDRRGGLDGSGAFHAAKPPGGTRWVEPQAGGAAAPKRSCRCGLGLRLRLGRCRGAAVADVAAGSGVDSAGSVGSAAGAITGAAIGPHKGRCRRSGIRNSRHRSGIQRCRHRSGAVAGTGVNCTAVSWRPDRPDLQSLGFERRIGNESVRLRIIAYFDLGRLQPSVSRDPSGPRTRPAPERAACLDHRLPRDVSPPRDYSGSGSVSTIAGSSSLRFGWRRGPSGPAG